MADVDRAQRSRVGCGSGDHMSSASMSVSTVTVTVTETSAVAVSPTTTADETPQATRATEAVDETTTARGGLTTSQSNAVGKAREYLDISAFSRQELIDQLVYEGFTQAQGEAGAASQF